MKFFTNFFQRDKKIALHVVLALVIGFALLTLLVYLLPNSLVDIKFSEEVQEHQNPLLDTLMQAVSWFGNGIIPVLIVVAAAVLFLIFARRLEALYLLATLLSGVVIYGLKFAVNRPRPAADLVRIIRQAQFQSFPSGHVAFYVTFFGFLAFLMYRQRRLTPVVRWPVGLLSVGLIFTVPFSRVYLGVHWFTDVLAGFIIGLLCLIGVIYFYLKKAPPARPAPEEIGTEAGAEYIRRDPVKPSS